MVKGASKSHLTTNFKVSVADLRHGEAREVRGAGGGALSQHGLDGRLEHRVGGRRQHADPRRPAAWARHASGTGQLGTAVRFPAR